MLWPVDNFVETMKNQFQFVYLRDKDTPYEGTQYIIICRTAAVFHA